VSVVCVNGRFVAAKAARVSALDRGFLYGDGLFETVRAYGGRLFLPGDHFDRLAKGAEAVGIVPPFDADGFADLLEATRERNGLTDALVRLTLTRGEGPPVPDPAGSGPPTVVVTARPAPRDDPAAWQRGLSVVVARQVRAGQGALKSTSFLTHVLALKEARERGADEALLVNPAGEVAEGSVGNLFGVWAGRLATPDPGAGALPGVTRGVVLDRARRLRIPAEERAVPVKALEDAEELFLAGTGWEVMPVTRLEGRPVGPGLPGPVTERLRRAYREAVRAALSA